MSTIDCIFMSVLPDNYHPFSIVTGKSSNRWSAITIRLVVYFHVESNYLLLLVFHAALAIFSRSPAAYHLVQSMGIMQLPCDKKNCENTCTNIPVHQGSTFTGEC